MATFQCAVIAPSAYVMTAATCQRAVIAVSHYATNVGTCQRASAVRKAFFFFKYKFKKHLFISFDILFQMVQYIIYESHKVHIEFFRF